MPYNIDAHNAMNIHPGDYVEILRSVSQEEKLEKGWEEYWWIYKKDKTIGKVLKVVSDDGSKGFALEVTKYRTNDGKVWHYPYFCLRKFSMEKKTEVEKTTVTLNGQQFTLPKCIANRL